MMEEGWIFDNPNINEEFTIFDPTSPLDCIGRKVRRFFPGYGKSDGVIIAYLPPEKNEGLALWHMEHEDGDEEDLEEMDVEKVIRHMLCDAQQEDQNEVEEDENEVENEEGSEEGSDDDMSNSNDTVHLWPTRGVRKKWRHCVDKSQTVGEGERV